MALPLILAGIGAGLQGLGAWRQSRAQNRQNNRTRNYVDQYLGQGPSTGEDLLMDLFNRWNTGQDSVMQSLRADPLRQSFASNIGGLMETGDPFDTSELFAALQPIRQRARTEALGDLRAGAPGLGQRFGTAMMRGEEDLVQQLLEDQNVQDAGIQMESHENAQNRRLTAGQAVMQMLLGEGELGVADQGQGINMLQLLLQSQGNRRSNDTNLLSLLAGQPIPQSGASAIGGAGIDFAQIMLLRNLLGGSRSAPVTQTNRNFDI